MEANGYFIGLMSGTSMDGIDAVLAWFGEGESLSILSTHHLTYPAFLKRRIESLSCNEGTPSEIGSVDALVGDAFARCTLALLDRAGLDATSVTAIGSHGQTIHHQVTDNPCFSTQIGDPNRIAEYTGIATVSDFRRRDIAAGGQGAPLAPGFHKWYFSHSEHDRTLVNLGGMANITSLNADGSCPAGFDTGPGNRLLDIWCQDQWGCDFDAGGQRAAQGRVLPSLLERMLSDPYFDRQGPRSTGREHFNREWLSHFLQGFDAENSEDIQRTLTALTAETVVRGIRQVQRPSEVFLCGGGAFNPVLALEIAQRMGLTRVASTEVLGMDPQAVEGAAFAWLARQRLLKRSGNEPGVTGAAGSRVLGAVYATGEGGLDAE